MFPSFIGILDIQSWWEVPSIAYFCSLFRTAFNLLDFDIEELEEALLTDGTEDCASTLLTELIVRLLNGCLGNNDISAFNYQMFLRRLFRQKCQETGRYNPFNTDIDFQFLPLRTKVEILYALCDFRLDADDVFELFKNLDAESLRVEPLGWDDNSSAYWYFYGTRLYREDYKRKSKGRKKNKEEKRKKKLYRDDWLDDPDIERVWQVVCFTEADWTHLTEKFKTSMSRVEKELYQSLSENFLPEIPRLFLEKERLQRKRLLELAPRRTSNRVLQRIKQKEEEDKSSSETKELDPEEEEKDKREKFILGREHRAKRREQLRTRTSSSSGSSDSREQMPQKPKREARSPETRSSSKSKQKASKNSPARPKGEPPPAEPVVKTGRKTNNSLACATGQILIPDESTNTNSTRKILKTSQIFRQSAEDLQTDMYKVLEQLTAHEDAWPFMDPVEEEYAPNYYAVIRRPMDLRKMEERLDGGYYTDFATFKSDFKLIVNNCRLYNGQDNEYTLMVDKLQDAFDRLTDRYVARMSSSDEEIAVEYQIPTPARKHKRSVSDDGASTHKKRKTHSSNSEEPNSSRETDEKTPEDKRSDEKKEKKNKEREGKAKKKHKQHHHHGKHSKRDKNKTHHKSNKEERKHAKKSKKEKHRKKKHRHPPKESEIVLKRSSSNESLESSARSRSASPLPSIHTLTPSPSPSQPLPPSPLSPTSDQLNDPDFYKDKYDKIKERRRQAAKDKSSPEEKHHKQKSSHKPKPNLSIPDKDKNQKLRETIEKLKAKNERYKETLIFNNLFSTGSQTSADKSSLSSETLAEVASLKDMETFDFADESNHDSPKSSKAAKDKETSCKKGTKKSAAKNESATEALEQAVKDISKWLDEGPKGPLRSVPGRSPVVSKDEEDDDVTSRKRRPSSREIKSGSKKRDIHRTIERLHPGKSKGNLMSSSATSKVDEVVPLGPHNKPREIKSVLTTKVDELSPKLSLGSVLPAVGFTLGKDHKFSEDEVKEAEVSKSVEAKTESVEAKAPDVKKPDEKPKKRKSEEVPPEKKPETKQEPEKKSPKFSQEKATPNLSAWFKAFGAPKAPAAKKKIDEEPEEKAEEKPVDSKPLLSPKSVHKYDSPPDEVSAVDGGDSPIPAIAATRQRRTSTGSSVSERSSFSQDLDSPRHQMAHMSPLLRSPASPRTDDFQKITYPIINGTVRAGFYQDTASIKSSPEKSCSPRDGPQSPYSPYSQHVYASNTPSATPNPNAYSDSNKSPLPTTNKSPLPTYGLNQPPPYYDSSKAPIVNKPQRAHDDYTLLGPETMYQQTALKDKLVASSPAHSPYSQHSPRSPYSPIQNSPQTINQPILPQIEPKTPLFPVKKRMYNEEVGVTNAELSVHTDVEQTKVQQKQDYQKIVQSLPFPSDMMHASVDDIALALSKKSEAMKMNAAKEMIVAKETGNMGFIEKPSERHDVASNFNENIQEDTSKKVPNIAEKQTENTSAVDMINMGYMEIEKKSISETDILNASRELHKASLSKGFDIGAIAMNLGINKAAAISTQAQKYNQPSKAQKPNEHVNPNVLDFENIQAANQSVSNFGLSEFDLANKKFYSGGAMQANTPIDYGNYGRSDNQMRKSESVHSTYNNYPIDSTELNKMKSNMSISNPHVSNYSKPIQSPQFQGLPGARAPMARSSMQQSLPAELRIPNPRGMMNMADMSLANVDMMRRNLEAQGQAHSQKQEKQKSTTTSLPYKVPYSSQSSIPLDTLRNIPVSYLNDERFLSQFGYHDKNHQMAQMFAKSLPSEAHASSSIYSQATANMTKETMAAYSKETMAAYNKETMAAYDKETMSAYNKASNAAAQIVQAQAAQVDKAKQKRKKTEAKNSPMSNQTYQAANSNEALSSVKSSLVPGSAFNFGASGMAALGGMYGDASGFSLEDFRNSTANQYMAASYMAAAASAHQRTASEANEKHAKPAHQNAAHSGTGAFPFLGHGQTRAGYPFVGTDPSSPLYQQYLQRQEELLGAQIMGLYPGGYHSTGLRQPYDSLNRPPWL